MIKDMSFSSIPGRAVAFSLLFVAIIVASCVNDDYAGQQSGSSSGREVTVTVNIPRQQSPSTRSIDDQGGEAVVDNISLLVFEPATGGEKISEVVNGTILSQSSSSASNYEVKFKAVLKANATATTLAVIANAKDIVTALTPGMTKAASYQQLIYASTNAGGTPEDWKWKANKEAASSSSARPYIDYTPIPMHGEYTLPSGGVKEGMNISSIPLIRMLARIDIQNSFPGFTLDKVYLANYNTQGLVASDGNAGGGNPILNIPSGTNPQKGEANAQCYTYPASGGGLVGEITPTRRLPLPVKKALRDIPMRYV